MPLKLVKKPIDRTKYYYVELKKNGPYVLHGPFEYSETNESANDGATFVNGTMNGNIVTRNGEVVNTFEIYTIEDSDSSDCETKLQECETKLKDSETKLQECAARLVIKPQKNKKNVGGSRSGNLRSRKSRKTRRRNPKKSKRKYFI